MSPCLQYFDPLSFFFFFFFNDTATTEIYTLSLHDALPISGPGPSRRASGRPRPRGRSGSSPGREIGRHTSELQSRSDLVCRLLLEKKKRSVRHFTPVGNQPPPRPRRPESTIASGSIRRVASTSLSPAVARYSA